MKKLMYLALFISASAMQAHDSAVKNLLQSMYTFQSITTNPEHSQDQAQHAFQNYAVSLMKAFPALCDKAYTSWPDTVIFMRFFSELQTILRLLAQSNIQPEMMLTKEETEALQEACTRAMYVIQQAEEEFQKKYSA